MRDDRRVTTRGRVREWRDDEGSGVVDSDLTPGGCWTHYSSVLIAGYRTLAAGDDVELSFEELGQDGFAYRAV